MRTFICNLIQIALIVQAAVILLLALCLGVVLIAALLALGVVERAADALAWLRKRNKERWL